MPDVFLLGAGFSKAISDQMPLLREFSEQIKTTVPDLEPPHSILSNDLEVWLSYLSQPHPWLREQENLRNRALALDIAQKIKYVLSERERTAISNTCPNWASNLACYWHQHRSSVITLNYDTLVERTATECIAIQESVMPEDLYPVPFTLSTARNASVWGRQSQDSFTLFKLHGSVNWYYSGASESTGEVLYYSSVYGWTSDFDKEVESESAVNDKVPLIVPPTTEKSGFFQHESLRNMWTQAAQSIRSGIRIFVIGYSLPMTDLAVRLFLLEGGSSATQRMELFVVNPQACVVKRYRELLGSAFEVKDDYVGERAVERLVDDLCQDAEGSEL